MLSPLNSKIRYAYLLFYIGFHTETFHINLYSFYLKTKIIQYVSLRYKESPPHIPVLYFY